MFENKDLTNVITPVKVDVLEEMLIQADYNREKTEFLIQGFREGFDIGYQGVECVKMTSPNLQLRIGSETELWNKVMKEVELKRYAGPFESIPFEYFIQSPIGLVPKDGGTKTRLIFHLSYPRNGTKTSVNANTPDHLKRVKYSDFDQAIQLCIDEGVGCHLSKSDMTSAFRNLGLAWKCWKYMIMKARNPLNQQWFYFVDKCLPFGAAISCAIFQKFSDAVAYLVTHRTKKKNLNYLDDFLFVAFLRFICNLQTQEFLDICEKINFSVALEKTYWGTTILTFLGLLIDTVHQMVFVPLEKLIKGRQMVMNLLNKKSKKTTIRELQQLCGFLNFIGRAIVPGRAFTRRLYHYTKNSNLKPHHHVKINQEMRLDLGLWNLFLHHETALARPFLDFSKLGCLNAKKVFMYSDASGNFELGMGAICGSSWTYTKWPAFCANVKPSIEYLELYAVVTGVLLWISRFRNKRIILFCDNQAVVSMINNTSSSCKNCMVLIRTLVLKGLVENVRIFAAYVESKKNDYSDALSRLKLDLFWQISRTKEHFFEAEPTLLPQEIWPMDRIWLY